jgi:DNA-binding transcriptional regulator YhcF (GntR family)
MDLTLDRSRPLGAQLEARLRAAIDAGELAAGDRLPSLRDVAAEADVNVNTVRAAYARLESAGVVATEHGRGTFVADTRHALREEIERLEARLARLPAVPGDPPAMPAGLPTTAQLAAIRDELLARLGRLDAERDEVIARLRHLDRTRGTASTAAPDAAPDADSAASATDPAAPDASSDWDATLARRRSSSTLSGARVRWIGA